MFDNTRDFMYINSYKTRMYYIYFSIRDTQNSSSRCGDSKPLFSYSLPKTHKVTIQILFRPLIALTGNKQDNNFEDVTK